MRTYTTINEVVAQASPGATIGFMVLGDVMTIQINDGGLVSTVKFSLGDFHDLMRMVEDKQWKPRRF